MNYRSSRCRCICYCYCYWNANCRSINMFTVTD